MYYVNFLVRNREKNVYTPKICMKNEMKELRTIHKESTNKGKTLDVLQFWIILRDGYIIIVIELE